MYFVLSKFKESLLTKNQSLIFNNSSLIIRTSSPQDAWELKTLVSSANNIKYKVGEIFVRSLMYRMNSKGPRLDPWGTPQFIQLRSDHVPLQKTFCIYCMYVSAHTFL